MAVTDADVLYSRIVQAIQKLKHTIQLLQAMQVWINFKNSCGNRDTSPTFCCQLH